MLHPVLHAVKVLFFRFVIVAVSGAGLVFVLVNTHDYPQTRQAINSYETGDGLFWFVAFYFINEAGSGIKYEITGDRKHFAYFPRSDIDGTGTESRRTYDHALLGATQGDWQEQLRLSHLLVLGWGVERDYEEATRWYNASETKARELGEHDDWVADSRRKMVRAFIASDLDARRVVPKPSDPWREWEAGKADDIVTGGQRG